jgi:hypothetical protein
MSTPAPSPSGAFASDGEEPPRAGYRARQWRRFEHGFRAWLETPEGRFARFCAERECAPAIARADCA